MPSLPLRPPRTDLLAWLRRAVLRLLGVSTDRYRPEKHYMRGPGPKSGHRHPRVKSL